MAPNRKSKAQKKSPAKAIAKANKNKLKKRKLIPTKDFYVPEDKFNEALKAVHKDIEWGKGISQRMCSVAINEISSDIRQSYRGIWLKLLEEARLCLLQRDWKTLARVLAMAKPNTIKHSLVFQVYVRYAVICLTHNPDEHLLDTFMQGVAGCAGELQKQKFLNSLTN